jgi:hypothetical protein
LVLSMIFFFLDVTPKDTNSIVFTLMVAPVTLSPIRCKFSRYPHNLQ